MRDPLVCARKSCSLRRCRVTTVSSSLFASIWMMFFEGHVANDSEGICLLVKNPAISPPVSGRAKLVGAGFLVRGVAAC